MGGLGSLFPRSIAQLTGVVVAGIVGFGTDLDLFVAIPLGVFAGSFTALVLFYTDEPPPPRRRVARRKQPRRPPPTREPWRAAPRSQFGRKASPRPAGWR